MKKKRNNKHIRRVNNIIMQFNGWYFVSMLNIKEKIERIEFITRLYELYP